MRKEKERMKDYSRRGERQRRESENNDEFSLVCDRIAVGWRNTKAKKKLCQVCLPSSSSSDGTQTPRKPARSTFILPICKLISPLLHWNSSKVLESQRQVLPVWLVNSLTKIGRNIREALATKSDRKKGDRKEKDKKWNLSARGCYNGDKVFSVINLLHK